MDRLEAMRAFAAVADQSGFAPAARRLGLAPASVTRAVAALEERIGTRLFTRTTRVVRLTEAGTRFLADCKRILAEVDEAEAAAAGSHSEPRGQLVVTAPVMFGRMHVSPIIFDFLARHPRVSVRALFLDRVADLMDEGIDVAIRIGMLPDSSLSATRVGSVRRVVCASPAYLKAHGTPQTPADLARHAAIAFAGLAPGREWSFGAGKTGVTAVPPVRLEVNSADVAIAAAVAGGGLTRVLSYQVADELRARRLRLVLTEYEPPALPIHIVHAEGRRAPAKLRAFVDFAEARLRARKALTD
jgi:DNA-binding transcriptional LysR family regulator